MKVDPLLEIAAFVSSVHQDNIDNQLYSLAEMGVIDSLGNMISGLRLDSPWKLANAFLGENSDGRRNRVYLLRECSPFESAWIKAMAIHMLDYDDNHDVLGGHPSTVLVPALLSAINKCPHATLQDFLVSYIVGIEVDCKLGRCLNYRHYNLGWHPTSTIGIMGAAVAVAKLMKLSKEQIMNAVGLAASLASGLKENFGTEGKWFQVGHASSMGLLAACVAKEGFSCSKTILHGKQGFSNVYNQRPVDWSYLQYLGKKWDIIEPGLVIKLYPCCASTHAAIEGTLRLREKYQERLNDVESIVIKIHPDRLPHVNNPNPQNATQARFSIQYVVAWAWLYGFVGLETFNDLHVHDKCLRHIMAKVTVESIDESGWARTSAEVEIRFTSGDVDTSTICCAKGHGRQNPVDIKDIAIKFNTLTKATPGFDEVWEIVHDPTRPVSELIEYIYARV